MVHIYVVDDETQKAIAAWVAEGNKIKRDQKELVARQPATRTGCEGQPEHHIHEWVPQSQSIFECRACGAAGYGRKFHVSKHGTPRQEIVEYVCKVEGCPGWGIESSNVGSRRAYVCPEHVEDG